MALVDPAGLQGHVMLFIPSGAEAVLADTKRPGMFLSVDKKGKPEIGKHSRAKLMLRAVEELPPVQNFKLLQDSFSSHPTSSEDIEDFE